MAFPAGPGVNTADEPVFFDPKTRGSFIQQAVNLRIQHNRWRTRYRVRGQPVVGNPATVSQWQEDHTQAAMWFIPQLGQGVHYIGKSPDCIVESAAGRLYSLTPSPDGFTLADLSGGIQASPLLRLAWLEQAENYIIRTDGEGQTQIWDGTGTVFGSPGYNSTAKDRSRFPNAAGPTVYAGGRLYTVVFDRRILVSDALHQTDQVSAIDLLRFTDQSYDLTNTYFAPPTSELDIVALTVSISSGFDNSRAQGEVMSMCRGPGIWAMALGVPRAQWATAAMRHSRSKESAASGPRSFFVRDGDILMRTSRGIESLNLLARERQSLGNATIDLGANMFRVLHADDEQSLIFASLINPIRWSRMLCTAGPVIDGSRHYHLGWISGNWNPLSVSEPSSLAWEGVGTLDKCLGRVIQFLPAMVDGQTRVLALTDREDGTSKGLVEFAQEEGHDLLDDGSPVPIEWSLLTHKLMTGGPYTSIGLSNFYVYLFDMQTDVEVSVWVRDDKRRDFVFFRTIKALFRPEGRKCNRLSDRRLSFGKPTANGFKDSRWLQFYIAGKGVASVDFATRADPPDAPPSDNDPDCVVVESDPQCPIQFDPFRQSR